MKLNFVNMYIYKVLFPPTEDEKILIQQSTDSFSKKIKHQNIAGVQTLMPFKDPVVRAAIHTHKFHGNIEAKRLLAHALQTWLITLPESDHLLIPVPLSKQRLRSRGFNQARTIAQEALKNIPSITLTSTILIRTKHTPPQTSLQREQRLSNTLGAFAVNANQQHKITGQDIILFDDVLTTGATLHAAKATLLPHSPASITCVTLAH